MCSREANAKKKAILATALTCSLGAAMCMGAMVCPSNALATDEANSENTPQTPAAKSFPMKVNMVDNLPLSGIWKIKSSDKAIVKVGSDGSLAAKKIGKATITCTSYSGETRIFKVTVSKSTFKPVAMKKLQCYKGYCKYMTATQFKKAYKKAVKLATPAGDLSRKKKLQYVTSTLRQFFEKNMKYEAKKAHYNDPYGYLCLKRASCAGAARTTRLCLNILGIKAEHVNENKWTHQWCRVKVGKSYWIADPYGMYCGKEPGKRKHPYL